ncbi:MAG: hypothetical protein B7Z29_04375 [Hyphomicrobium sp. 12-62-95]|nr:MAG: hypothetical protein B7Z29_04375 [Hyphomicrobium sp. 12-62-95]
MPIDAPNLGGIDERAIFDAAYTHYDGTVAMHEAQEGTGDPDTMWKRLSDALDPNAYVRDQRVAATVAEHWLAGGARAAEGLSFRLAWLTFDPLSGQHWGDGHPSVRAVGRRFTSTSFQFLLACSVCWRFLPAICTHWSGTVIRLPLCSDFERLITFLSEPVDSIRVRYVSY